MYNKVHTKLAYISFFFVSPHPWSISMMLMLSKFVQVYLIMKKREKGIFDGGQKKTSWIVF